MSLPEELLVFVATLLSALFLLRWWIGLDRARLPYPPSLPSLPLVGSLPFLRGFNNIAEYFMRKADQLGPIFTFRTGNNLILVLNNREVIKDALVSHSSAFSGRPSLYIERFANPNRKGLIIMNTTQEWKKYHQLSLSILKQLGFGVKSTMESRILKEFDFFKDYVLKLNGQSFNPKELMYLSTSNIIMNVIFGRRRNYNLGINTLVHELKRLFENLDMISDFVPILRFLPFHKNKLHQIVECQKIIQKMIGTEIEKSLEDGADDCFVRRYLERVGPDYDHEQLSFTLRDLVGAATDTVANTIFWALIALANNPDVQNRIRADINAVVPRDKTPSIDDQPKLPFVEATILEIMRWRTLGPLAVPHTTLVDTNIGDYFIPAGTWVLINLYAAHMDPKVWKDPEIFRPERFLDKEGQVIHRESTLHFSVGRRSCLGEVLGRAELFLILTGLVQCFFIQPPEGQDTVNAEPIKPIVAVQEPPAFSIRLIATG